MHGHSILACCDAELIGKKIEDDKFSVEIRASFYKDIEVSAEQLSELLRESGSANLFGKKCIAVAIEEGFINQSSIIMIKDVPHAQIYKI
jgi:hypothetical protein